MRGFFTLRFRPTAETWWATALVAAYVLVLAAMMTLVAPRFPALAGNVVTAFYAAMFAATLVFVRRRSSFAAVGVTRRRWVVAAMLGLLIGGLGLVGTRQCFPGGSFALPAWPGLLALLAAGLSAGLMEDMALYGYFQFRWEEAFGPPAAVLGSALAWTLAHGAVLTLPGAGTYAAACVGTGAFLTSLFVTFLILGLIVHFTRNIWAGVVQNAVMGNVLTNLYMWNATPEEVFTANPDNLPVALLVALFVVTGLAWAQHSVSRRNPAR